MTATRTRSLARRHPDAVDVVVATAFGLTVGAGTIAQRGTDTDTLLAAASLGLAIGLAILWSLRRRRDRTQREAQAILEQRLEVARELHDVVGHHVSVIGIQAAAARRTLGRSPDETAAALTAIEASVASRSRRCNGWSPRFVVGASRPPAPAARRRRPRHQLWRTCPTCAGRWRAPACT